MVFKPSACVHRSRLAKIRITAEIDGGRTADGTHYSVGMIGEDGRRRLMTDLTIPTQDRAFELTATLPGVP